MVSVNSLKKDVKEIKTALNVDIEPFTLIANGKTVSLTEGINQLITFSREVACANIF